MNKLDKIVRSPVLQAPSDRTHSLPTVQPVIRVLAVDDEPCAVKLLSLFLREAGVDCTTAVSGGEALDFLRRQPFDAVISDLQMPGLSGMELLTQVRCDYPNIAFLVTTGVDDVDVGVEAMRLGADDYLVKPLRDNAVLASLNNALHKRQLEKQVEDYRLRLESMVEERTSQLQMAVQKVHRTCESTVQALGRAIDLRDNETAGHSQRVCCYSLEIATALGWPEEQLRRLAKGAYLHDIGKIGIPDAILLKPGPLTPEERTVMQGHVRIGFDLVRNIEFLEDAAEIVLTHHEHFDGGGYPQGLAADSIPLGARIFAVADALDAITSNRPYRRASSIEEARNRICEESGRQFDPLVVNIFQRIPMENWQAIARNQVEMAALSSGWRSLG